MIDLSAADERVPSRQHSPAAVRDGDEVRSSYVKPCRLRMKCEKVCMVD